MVGFSVIQITDSVSTQRGGQFAKRHLKAKQTVFTNALYALNVLTEERPMPPSDTIGTSQPLAAMGSIAIANLKRYLLGTYHGVTAIHAQHPENAPHQPKQHNERGQA